jgi:hypothetical protein
LAFCHGIIKLERTGAGNSNLGNLKKMRTSKWAHRDLKQMKDVTETLIVLEMVLKISSWFEWPRIVFCGDKNELLISKIIVNLLNN